MRKRIGILTAGSDSPGLNATIRGLGKAALGTFGMDLIGFVDGFQGLVEDKTVEIFSTDLSGILTDGGTFLGTSRDSIQDYPLNDGSTADRTDQAIETLKKHKLDALVCLGGHETQITALHLQKKGVNIIGIPKSITNNIPQTDTSVGFDTALGVATEAIDRLHSTAHSHHRIMIVEIMGRHAGWLTLGAGIAGGADAILIPEIAYDPKLVAQAINDRRSSGKRFSIIAVAENAMSLDYVEFFEHSRKMNHRLRSGEEETKIDQELSRIENQIQGNTLLLADRLHAFTGLDTRITILGHLLRGGTPSASDRLLATQFGTACADLIQRKQYGVMIAKQGMQTVPVPLEQIAGKVKQVPLDDPWIIGAKHVGTVFGD
ncbi:MAG: ATP-dependent 6-phosphofructokinase [Anaerolineaceae bacterium]|nr:ATP-dependent 6-phosphofructokinase [Anaerolineaceae bacterium]